LVDITMPQLGETVAEGTVLRWRKAVGDAVAREEILFEVSTDKVDTEIPSPVAGYLTEILVEEGVTVVVGTKLAVVSSEVSADSASPTVRAATTRQAGTAKMPKDERPLVVLGTSSRSRLAGGKSSRTGSGANSGLGVPDTTISPVVRRLVAEHNIDLSDLRGSGLDGRITRADVLAYVDSARRKHGSVLPTPPSPAPTNSSATSVALSQPVVPVGLPGDNVIRFTSSRRSAAERVVRSKATSAHTLVVTEVDFENIKVVRTNVKDAFKAEHGVTLSYLPFVARALAEGIRAFPQVNSSVGENSLIIHADMHLGIEVDLGEEERVVPVIYNLDAKRMPTIAKEIAELTEKARAHRLSPAETSGGTFTITNPEPFGTFLTAPIINQPQVAILSVNEMRRRPVAVSLSDGSEAVAIHSVGLLALSFDHRAIDGSYASQFLARMQEVLQNWDWTQEL